MKKFTLIILIMILYLLPNKNTYGQCSGKVNEADSLAFLELIPSHYHYETAYYYGATMSDWEFIRLKEIDGECRIDSLYLWCPDVNILLEKELIFPHLTVLTLDYCQLESFNQLNKEHLPQLKKLNIYDVWEVEDQSRPDFDLPNLEELGLYDIITFVSEMPDFIKMPNLKKLTFREHDSRPTIQGILPNFSGLPNLEDLRISLAHIDGSLPNFSNLPNLKNLTLDCSLNGSIPNFDKLPNLENLDLSNNQFSGSIPDFNNFHNLKNLKLSYNQLTGPIPDFSNMGKIETIVINNNQLEGEIPNFTNIPSLRSLSVSVNSLTGIIPNFSNLPLLNTLFVCGYGIFDYVNINEFSSPIPTLENCPLLNKDNINFSCVEPPPKSPNCPLSVSDSLELVNFYNVTNGDNWERNNGWLTENGETWWGIELTDTLGECRVTKILIRGITDSVTLPTLNLPFLEELILDYNNFTGDLPNLSNLTNLKILNLAANDFTGDLPDLSALIQLEEINLSQNNLTGELSNFAAQNNLKILNLGDNNLTGEISEFVHPFLTQLDLSNNLLQDSIPDLNSLPELIELNLSGNMFEGNMPNFSTIPNLTYLNLSENTLVNTIPDFNNLPNLVILNIGNNQLSGTIPDFSNLPLLETLFLNDNQLEGQIPNFSFLTILQELSLCDNQLVGIVPNFSSSPMLDVSMIDFSCIQSAKVRGKVYYDANENCIFDDGDTPIPNGLVSVNNGLNYQPVDELGNYEVAVEVGTSEITFIQISSLWNSSCENTLTITSLTVNDITEIDFANQPNAECTELTVDIGTPFLRRCFKNTYTIQYCNQGTQPATDAYIEIDFEDEIIPLNASIPYEENDNLLTFQLGEIGIGKCGTFTVVDSVSCTAPLSAVGCVEAHIYPDGYCEIPSTIWDGANLKVDAFCLANDSVQFVIENLGEDMANPSRYKMYVEDVYTVQGELQLGSGAAKVLNYAATGETYRVAVEQTPGHPSQDNPQAFFEFCGDGNFSTGYINSQLLPDKDEFIDIDCEEIIGSYDPNDKLVTPAGVGESHDIYKGDELTYKIRFQNTGNDTAFTVILVDTLDFEHLNISTLEILNSSHPHTLSIEDAQILTFTFDNILIVGVENETINHLFIRVYPNPASSVFYLEMPDDILQQYPDLQLEMFNTKGQVVLANYLNKTQLSFDISKLKNGIYYYNLFSKSQLVTNGKLLIQ